MKKNSRPEGKSECDLEVVSFLGSTECLSFSRTKFLQVFKECVFNNVANSELYYDIIKAIAGAGSLDPCDAVIFFSSNDNFSVFFLF